VAAGIHDSHSHTLVLIAGEYPEQLFFKLLIFTIIVKNFPAYPGCN